MKFTVEKLPQAEAEIKDLEESQQKLLSDEYTKKIIVIGVVFVKKSQKTPKEIIKLAKKRLKEV